MHAHIISIYAACKCCAHMSMPCFEDNCPLPEAHWSASNSSKTSFAEGLVSQHHDFLKQLPLHSRFTQKGQLSQQLRWSPPSLASASHATMRKTNCRIQAPKVRKAKGNDPSRPSRRDAITETRSMDVFLKETLGSKDCHMLSHVVRCQCT